MRKKDNRPDHLGWVEIAIQTANLDLPDLQISAQSRYGPPNRIAFVNVYGVDDDQTRRRQIRAHAGDFLCRLGYTVELEPGRDVYDLSPVRAASNHDRLWMLQCLLTVLDQDP